MRVTFEGRIAIEPTVTTLQSGKQVNNFSVAVNDGYKNRVGEWIDKTSFVKCAYWKQDAKIVPFLTKGKLVKLEAFIEAEGYENKRGEVKGALKGTVKWMKLLEGKKNTTTTIAAITEAETKDDLPF